MARISSKNRKVWGPATIKVAMVGLVLSALITAAGGYAEVQGSDSTWYLKLLKNQGTDFSYVGLLTFTVMVGAQIRHHLHPMMRPVRLDFAKWGPLTVASFTLLDGFLIELFQSMHGHGDGRDLLAEALGWICTMLPVTFAQRRDLRRPVKSKITPRTLPFAPAGATS
jgi:hypothetical protein